MENLRNRINVKLVNNEKFYLKCTSEPRTMFEIRTFHLAGYFSGKLEESLNQNKRSKNQLWVWGSL